MYKKGVMTMKKILPICLVVLIFAFTASSCTNKRNDSNTYNASTTTESETVVTTTSPSILESTTNSSNKEDLLPGDPEIFEVKYILNPDLFNYTNVKFLQKYIGKKTVKEYTLVFSFYDSNGELLNDTSYSGKPTYIFVEERQIDEGDYIGYSDYSGLRLDYFNSECAEVRIDEIYLEYLDGSTDKIVYNKSTTEINRVQLD